MMLMFFHPKPRTKTKMNENENENENNIRQMKCKRPKQEETKEKQEKNEGHPWLHMRDLIQIIALYLDGRSFVSCHRVCRHWFSALTFAKLTHLSFANLHCVSTDNTTKKAIEKWFLTHIWSQLQSLHLGLIELCLPTLQFILQKCQNSLTNLECNVRNSCLRLPIQPDPIHVVHNGVNLFSPDILYPKLVRIMTDVGSLPHKETRGIEPDLYVGNVKGLRCFINSPLMDALFKSVPNNTNYDPTAIESIRPGWSPTLNLAEFDIYNFNEQQHDEKLKIRLPLPSCFPHQLTELELVGDHCQDVTGIHRTNWRRVCRSLRPILKIFRGITFTVLRSAFENVFFTQNKQRKEESPPWPVLEELRLDSPWSPWLLAKIVDMPELHTLQLVVDISDLSDPDKIQRVTIDVDNFLKRLNKTPKLKRLSILSCTQQVKLCRWQLKTSESFLSNLHELTLSCVHIQIELICPQLHMLALKNCCLSKKACQSITVLSKLTRLEIYGQYQSACSFLISLFSVHPTPQTWPKLREVGLYDLNFVFHDHQNLLFHLSHFALNSLTISHCQFSVHNLTTILQTQLLNAKQTLHNSLELFELDPCMFGTKKPLVIFHHSVVYRKCIAQDNTAYMHRWPS